MRLLVASEAHFVAAPDGSIYAQGAEDYGFWSSYLDSFDEVGVLARMMSGPAQAGASRADGPGVRFHELHNYCGPWEYLGRLARLRPQARQALNRYMRGDALLLRAPGAIAYLAWNEIQRSNPRKPYAVEVLGDPWESLAGSAGVWSGVARRWSRNFLRRICRYSSATCYVTRSCLQERYPGQGMIFSCSDVRLRRPAGEAELKQRRRRAEQAASGERPWEIGFIGSLERLYKAPDVHLHAIRICLDRGIDLRFSAACEGRNRRSLERLAAGLGISSKVRFLGALPPGPAIDNFLDGIDLFVIGSRTEGLPRALVEAMARGCPAVGSTAGGIPELLPTSELVEPGRAAPLAGKIAEVLRDPARLAVMSRRNRAVSESFSLESLGPVRREFLNQVRRLTAEFA